MCSRIFYPTKHVREYGRMELHLIGFRDEMESRERAGIYRTSFLYCQLTAEIHKHFQNWWQSGGSSNGWRSTYSNSWPEWRACDRPGLAKVYCLVAFPICRPLWGIPPLLFLMHLLVFFILYFSQTLSHHRQNDYFTKQGRIRPKEKSKLEILFAAQIFAEMLGMVNHPEFYRYEDQEVLLTPFYST